MKIMLVIALAALGTPVQCAIAQDFPTRPIRFIMPFPPGGAIDINSRLVSERLSPRLGQQIVVDNRPGANGAIAFNIMALAAPDGYTIMAVALSFLTHQTLYRDFKYDVRKDLSPIILGAKFSMVLVVNPSVPASSVKELIDLAKAPTGALAYGDNGGMGSSGHIAAESFKQRTGLRITHVPYKGAAPMFVDLLGGHIQMAFTHITSVLPHIRSGRVRALSTTSAVRLPALPEIHTMVELGFAGFNTGEFWAVVGPKGMPAAVVDKLNREIAAIINTSLRDRLVSEGAQIVAGPPQQFAEFIAAEVPILATVLQQAGLKAGAF